MKFTALRRYIKSKNLQKPYSLQNRELVIDGHSYFKDSYRKSGCQFILGTDCDQYADYLASKLGRFVDCNIKCYVIFKGTTNDTIEKRQQKHQKIIDDRRNIENNLENPSYFDPLLVDDVQKQVLEVMGINYFCCANDESEAIIGVARHFKCPVLTDNVEYCLFGVSCILPNSFIYKENDKSLECTMYEHQTYKAAFGLYNKIPILLTVISEHMDFLDKLPELCCSVEKYDIAAVIRWVKRQRDDVTGISKKINDETSRVDFLELFERIKMLYFFPSRNLGVKYFLRKKAYGLFKDDKKWLAKGVSNGRIAISYFDIKRKGFISGSTLVNDIHKPDALLAATKIIAYSHCLLTNSRKSTLNFIGRKDVSSAIWEIDTEWGREIHNRAIFTMYKRTSLAERNPFCSFIKDIMSGTDITQAILLTCLPRACWILVFTLVYYIQNVNKDFIDGAYFVLLSYLMLGPVSLKLYGAQKGDSISNDSSYEDCQKMYDGLKFLFRKVDVKLDYNTDILHSLAEFQHCLQHMNYLNKLCGTDIPCTMYHDTYNGTFVYNTFISMRNKDNLMAYLESKFKESWPFKLYKYIVAGFETCRQPSPELKLLLTLGEKIGLGIPLTWESFCACIPSYSEIGEMEMAKIKELYSNIDLISRLNFISIMNK